MAELLTKGKELQVKEIQPKDAERGFTLEECYEHIGCDLVEVVNLNDGRIIILDEEGLLKADPVINFIATGLASHAYKQFFPIVGNCILCKDEEFK